MTAPEIVLAVIFVVFLSICAVYIARTRGRNQTNLSAAEREQALNIEKDVARTQEPRRG